jgi:hypothetical protein
MVHCKHESCGAAEKELENMAFDDAYFMTKSAQEKVLGNVVQKYCKVSGAEQ